MAISTGAMIGRSKDEAVLIHENEASQPHATEALEQPGRRKSPGCCVYPAFCNFRHDAPLEAPIQRA